MFIYHFVQPVEAVVHHTIIGFLRPMSTLPVINTVELCYPVFDQMLLSIKNYWYVFHYVWTFTQIGPKLMQALSALHYSWLPMCCIHSMSQVVSGELISFTTIKQTHQSNIQHMNIFEKIEFIWKDCIDICVLSLISLDRCINLLSDLAGRLNSGLWSVQIKYWHRILLWSTGVVSSLAWVVCITSKSSVLNQVRILIPVSVARRGHSGQESIFHHSDVLLYSWCLNVYIQFWWQIILVVTKSKSQNISREF